MKRFLVLVAAVAVLFVTNVSFASTVSVVDAGSNMYLYQYVNNLCGTKYTSSNEMLADLGYLVGTGNKFDTSNAQLEGYAMQSWYDHDIGIIDPDSGARLPIFAAEGSNIKFKYLDGYAIPDISGFYWNAIIDLDYKRPGVQWELNSTGEYSSNVVPDLELASVTERFIMIDITSIYSKAEDGKTYWLFALETDNDSSYTDFVAVISNISPAAVPEPTTMALIGLGGAFLVARRRILARRKNHSENM